jgi:acetyl esterase/lipase
MLRALTDRISIVKLPSWNIVLSLTVSLLRGFIKSHSRDLKTLRAVTDFDFLPTIPMGASSFSIRISEVPVEIVHPRTFKQTHDMGSYRVIMYLHGGGGAVCSPVTHRVLTHPLAVASEAVVVVPRYRRVPENLFSDAVDDAFNVFLALIKLFDVKRENLSICGDSAGGAIAVLTLVRIRDECPSALPASLGLLSPWSDIHAVPPIPKIDVDYICPEILEFMSLMVNKNTVNKFTNPMNHSFEGFPPVLIQAGDSELLIEQIKILSTKFETESDERVAFIQYREMIHIPHLFSFVSSTGKNAMRDLAQFIKSNTPL